MKTARAFELRTIRRHLVCRWLAWIGFAVVTMAVHSGLVFAIGFLALAVYMEKQWPLPDAKLFGWRMPSNLLTKGVALIVVWLVAKALIPALQTAWGDQLVGTAALLLFVLFLCSQVQLLRGRGVW